MLVRFNGACYRHAAPNPSLLSRAAQWFLSRLWEGVYQTGMTYEELSKWLWSILGVRARSAAGWDPEDEDVASLAQQLLKVLAKSGMFPADLWKEISTHKLLDHPPAPYRWELDNFGRKRLVETRSEVPEHGVVRGKKFKGKSLIGIWWTTKKQRSRAHKEFLKWIRENQGDVFLNWTIPGEEGGMGGGREYGGFIIVPTEHVPDYGAEVKNRVEKVTQAGDGEYRLSGVKLDRLAEGERIENSDQLRVPGVVNSIKFNWDYNLPTLLNGGVAEYKRQQEYTDLVEMLREARDAA